MKKIFSLLLCLVMLLGSLPAAYAVDDGNTTSSPTVDSYVYKAAVDEEVYGAGELPQTPEAYAASDYAQLAARMACGANSAAVVLPDGSVETWGDNSHGQLEMPVGLTGVKSISVTGHTLALKEDGTVVSWGNNSSGQCDIPDVLTGKKVKAVATGSIGTSAVLTEDNKIVVWGSFVVNNQVVKSIKELDLNGKTVATIDLNSRYLVALGNDGKVTAWNRENSFQQCDVPTEFSSHVVDIAAGSIHVLALMADGTVTSWGNDNYPVPAGLKNVRAIAAGDFFSVALTADGNVTVWGSDNHGYGLLNVPTTLGRTQALAAGVYNIYALQEDGTVVAWGDNRAGQCYVPEGLNLTSTVSVNNRLYALSVAAVVYEAGEAKITSCGIYPKFSCIQSEGVVDVDYEVAEVRISAQPYSSKATLEIDGKPAAAGVASVFNGSSLAIGDNTIEIKVTAECGSQRTYTLHVKRVSSEYALPQTPQAYQASEYTAYVRRLAAGSNSNLVLKKDGTVIAWGRNSYGQCNVPAGLDNVTDLAVGSSSLALKKDGTVIAWGGMHGESDVPDGLIDVVDISCSNVPAALTKNGRVVVWGDNSFGQCDVPAGLNETGDVVGIECGTRHMLALKADGTVVAWGDNSFGQCNVPAGLDHVVAIAAHTYYSMALKADGTLVIWGTDFNGVELENIHLQYVKAIVVGSDYAAALKWDGNLAVWGNQYGENVDLGVPLELDQEILAISSDSYSLLALNEDGTVTAWGDNTYGRCDVPQGLNLFADDPPPYSGPAPNIPQTPAAYAASDYIQAAAKVISLGGGHAVLNMDGTVKVCDPKNYHGEANVPEGLNNVKSIMVAAFIMALQQDGTVVVWGDNRDGACDVPENLSNVTAIAASNQYCLALKEDGTVVAWGGNYNGECDVPENLDGVKAIAADFSHCLALKEDGTVAAWGNNDYGQCDVPAGLTNVARVFTDSDYSVALKNDGTVVAWGNNEYGQLDVPPGLSNVVDICVNGTSCIALRGNGTVVVWGNNSYGNRNVPVGLHDVAAVCAGGLAVKADGTVVTWGAYTKYAEELAAETNVLTITNHTIIYRDGTLKYFGDGPYNEEINQMLEGLNVLSGHYFAVDKVELLDSSGQSITSVAGQSGYRINANIANNYCAPQDGLVIMQVRTGDGATAAGGGQVLECVGLAGEIPVDGKAVSTDFTMPGSLSGQAYVDVFVWDGWETMVPRANPSQNLSFTVTEQ